MNCTIAWIILQYLRLVRESTGDSQACSHARSLTRTLACSHARSHTRMHTHTHTLVLLLSLSFSLSQSHIHRGGYLPHCIQSDFKNAVEIRLRVHSATFVVWPSTLGLMRDAWCVMRDAWCVMRDAWCVMRDAWHSWDVALIHMWYDSFICVPWLIHTCAMTHLNVWHYSLVQSGENASNRTSPSAKETLILGLFCRERPIS